MKQAFGARPQLVAFERLRRDGGFHFVDYLDREAKTLGGVESLTAASYTVRSTINPPCSGRRKRPCRRVSRATS